MRVRELPGEDTVKNEYSNQGKDDVTGENLMRRVDDTEEAIRRRLEVYAKTESKVAAYYKFVFREGMSRKQAINKTWFLEVTSERMAEKYEKGNRGKNKIER